MQIKGPKNPPGVAVTFDGEVVPAEPAATPDAASAVADRVETGLPATPPPGAPPLLPIPDVMQQTDFTCGPASLRSVLAYLGARRVPEPQLARLMKTSSEVGTDPTDLRDGARALGLWAEVEDGMSVEQLADRVRDGVVPIVLFQAWKDPARAVTYQDDWDDGHYSVVIGVDRANVYLEDPWVLGRIETIPRDAFVRRWHGTRNDGGKTYQLAVLVSDRQPDDAD